MPDIARKQTFGEHTILSFNGTLHWLLENMSVVSVSLRLQKIDFGILAFISHTIDHLFLYHRKPAGRKASPRTITIGYTIMALSGVCDVEKVI